jgi:putative phosphoesterase
MAEGLIGVISDTHGLVRPEAVAALGGAELILHAGDIGGSQVLEAFRRVAPVVAVRGNNDRAEWARELPASAVVKVGAVSVYMLHDLKELDFDPAAEGFRVIVSGHSHRPAVREEKGVLYLNPGSAGPRRFKLPVSVAHLRINGEDLSAQLITLPM